MGSRASSIADAARRAHVSNSCHFVNIVIRLHENALINVKIGDDDSEVESSIGVRQGSCEGPILLLFVMQTAMETLTWPIAKPAFRTRSQRATMGERSFLNGEASEDIFERTEY